jgi:hypothetical protein
MNLVIKKKLFATLTGIMLWRLNYLLSKLMALGIWYLLFLVLILLIRDGCSK